MECGVDKSLPWQDIEEDEKETMTTSMKCEVDFATDCKPKTSQKCNEIEYMECIEEEKQECPKTTVQMPTQTFEHKKKCLLPDDGSLRKYKLIPDSSGILFQLYLLIDNKFCVIMFCEYYSKKRRE